MHVTHTQILWHVFVYTHKYTSVPRLLSCIWSLAYRHRHTHRKTFMSKHRSTCAHAGRFSCKMLIDTCHLLYKPTHTCVYILSGLLTLLRFQQVPNVTTFLFPLDLSAHCLPYPTQSRCCDQLLVAAAVCKGMPLSLFSSVSSCPQPQGQGAGRKCWGSSTPGIKVFSTLTSSFISSGPAGAQSIP